MTALAPILQALLHRPADRRSARPARTPSPPTATPCGCCSSSPATRPANQPVGLDLTDLDAALIAAFLDHLETERGNSVRTRNARLAAIHSLFRYAALRHPEHAAVIATGAGHPAQTRRPGRVVTYLTERRDRRAARRARPQHLDSADATTPCSPSPSRPGCASPS